MQSAVNWLHPQVSQSIIFKWPWICTFKKWANGARHKTAAHLRKMLCSDIHMGILPNVENPLKVFVELKWGGGGVDRLVFPKSHLRVYFPRLFIILFNSFPIIVHRHSKKRAFSTTIHDKCVCCFTYFLMNAIHTYYGCPPTTISEKAIETGRSNQIKNFYLLAGSITKFSETSQCLINIPTTLQGCIHQESVKRITHFRRMLVLWNQVLFEKGLNEAPYMGSLNIPKHHNFRLQKKIIIIFKVCCSGKISTISYLTSLLNFKK